MKGHALRTRGSEGSIVMSSGPTAAVELHWYDVLVGRDAMEM